MSSHPILHSSFTIERQYRADVARVFAAWADIETKARWFMGPPDTWTLVERGLDFRVGGAERLHGRFGGGRESLYEARFHAIEPGVRLAYVYDMFVNGTHLSVSLASVEFHAGDSGGTRMVYTEQVAFLDGEDGTRSRERGTDAHFDRLGSILDDAHDIVSARTFAAPLACVYAAHSTPEQLVSWWGPAGFVNEIHQYDLQAGGLWRLSMRAPDGSEHHLTKRFLEVRPGERIVLRQEVPAGHAFTMTMTFLPMGDTTHVVWALRFDSADEAAAVRPFVEAANEQNFDRLAAFLYFL